MRFLSCFSGIEAASVAWHPLGWQTVGVAEREPFPCAVLAHHYPDVPNLGDVTADDFLDRCADLRPDLLVGGPPCQDFSVAGLRAGIYGDRGNLTLRWVQIIHATRPRFTVTENVPGWLSANGGHAFGAFLAGLVGSDSALVPPKECGGQWTNAGMVDGPIGRAAWRILDAQYFGLAQRRKRVFVVFCPRGGGDPAAVLFEPASLRGHPAPRREARERVAAATAPSLTASGRGVSRTGESRGQDPVVAMCLNAHPNRSDGESETFVVAHSLRAEGFDASEDGAGGDLAFTVRASSGGGDKPHVMTSAVRRLTPRECERLQGFPDDYTLIPGYRSNRTGEFGGNKGVPDGPRYRALGNSMATNVMAWIGRRIAIQDAAS